MRWLLVLAVVLGVGPLAGIEARSRTPWPPVVPVQRRAREYRIRSLGFQGYATAVNNLGQIVGVVDPFTDHRAVLWENGALTDLGSLGGGHTQPEAINDLGQIVGSSQTATGLLRAFLWENGVMTDLGSLGGGDSEAFGINNQGQIVGSADTGEPGVIHAALWQAGHAPQDLTPGQGGGAALGTNRRGEAAGAYAADDEADSDAVRWSGGRMQVLPHGRTRSYFSFWAESINDRGDVAGAKEGGGDRYALCWIRGRKFSLPGLMPPLVEGGLAYAINNHGLIAGDSMDNSGIRMATLWRNRRPLALGNLHTAERERYSVGTDGLDSEAYGINDRGQIVGDARADDGTGWAVVWNPRRLQP